MYSRKMGVAAKAIGHRFAPHRAGPALRAAATPEFVFDVNGKRTHFSDKNLLRALLAFAATVAGRPFSMDEFDLWPDRPCRSTTIARRFRTWRCALSLAGIDGGRAAHYDPEELITNLEDVWRELGRPPGQHSLRRYGRITIGPYRRRWGTLLRACEQLARYHRGEISRQELLAVSCRPLRRKLSPAVRWSVLQRDSHRCAACGKAAGEPGVKLEVDHIVPVSAGGTDELSNLRVLCAACNRGKGAQSPGQAA